MLVQQCAWCKNILGQVPSLSEGVSHGICETCEANLLKRIQPPLQTPATHSHHVSLASCLGTETESEGAAAKRNKFVCVWSKSLALAFAVPVENAPDNIRKAG